MTNSIISWHQVDTRLLLETWLLLEQVTWNPRLVLETCLLFETRLVYEVLRYLKLIIVRLEPKGKSFGKAAAVL